MRRNVASNSICSSAYSIATKKKKRQWKQMGITQPKHLRVLFSHRRRILRSRADSTVVSVVMDSASCMLPSNGRCEPLICCRSAGHFMPPLKCRMRAALVLLWTLIRFFFLCSFGQSTLTVNWTGVFFAPEAGKIQLVPLWSGRPRY